MGNHLLDSRSPELKDSLPVTATFIYEAYDGELIFWEPMVTLEVLQKLRDVEALPLFGGELGYGKS